MPNDKPKNIHEYKRWLKEKHEIEILDRDQTYYEAVVASMKSDFESSEFWGGLVASLREFNDEYLLKTGYALLIDFEPKVYPKPFASFLDKTYRKNVLLNRQWPKEPRNGWILPNNWYYKINDIIRTFLVVKYLDGVEFLVEKVRGVCQQCDAACDVFLEARETGYYAAHVYTRQNFEIPRVTWDTERVDVSIEIQITTQLHEVIRKLLHKFYEERRQSASEDTKWQWDYKSDEFAANYLGHILHYVEGMIMDIRAKQKGG